MPIADLILIPTVQAFLMDGAVMTVFEAILEKFALPKERAIELLDLTDAVLDETLAMSDIPALLQTAFGIEETRAIRMACDVVGFRLLPLEEYVPGVSQQITAWGGDCKKYPKSRVGKLVMTPDSFAAKLDEKMGLNFSEVLVKRCGFLLHSYWKGEKTKESTLTFFSRPSSIGGLGLAPEVAQNLLALIDDEREMVELVESGVLAVGSRELDGSLDMNSGEKAVMEMEKAGEELLPRNNSQTDLEISPSHEVAAAIPVVNGPGTAQKEDDSDLIAGKKIAQRLQHLDHAEHFENVLRDAVHSARDSIAASGITEVELVDVFRKALMGVRDLYQTRDIFQRVWRLDAAHDESLTEILEEAYRRVHRGTDVSHQEGEVHEAAEGDGDVLNQRFAALTRTHPTHAVHEVLPGARVSMARTARQEKDEQFAAIAADRLAEATIASKPIPVKPLLTVGSMAPVGKDTLLTDVKTPRRLMGPLEELGTMTPAAFRRLSNTPTDATQKIHDILATLEKESYEERVKGIRAWRQSPMNQLYVAMTTEALQKNTVLAEIAGQRRAAGEESLSPAEIRALATLNDALRF